MTTRIWGNSARKRIKVEPLRSRRYIFLIREHLKTQPRNLCLFVMGINNGLRMIDLLAIKVGQVKYLKPGESVTIKESKTNKDNDLVMNGAIHRALHRYLSKVNLSDEDYLFKSPRGGHLASITAGKLVQGWCQAIGLKKDNYGAHTLRKTWAFTHRTYFHTPWELICKRLNHSSPAITQIYLGISREEIIDLIAKCEI